MKLSSLSPFANRGPACMPCLAAVALGFVLSNAAAAQDDAADTAVQIGQTRTVIEQWVETERAISKEKHEWELTRQMLTERIELVQREIASLREKIAEAEQNITETDANRQKLLDELEAMKRSADGLKQVVVDLEQQTGALLRRLPNPLRERVRPLSQRLPDDPLSTDIKLAERFQNVIGILNDINKFNREITATSEVLEMPGGKPAQVTSLYVGIGQGYYVDKNGTTAGVGTATADGWVWVSANAAAPRIRQAIAILGSEQVAAYVRLPLAIDNQPAAPNRDAVQIDEADQNEQ